GMGVKVPSSGRISRPWRGRSRSRMISGRSSDTTYEQTENLKPGKTSSVTAAPPTMWRRSRTRTLRPARARYAADVSPLWPPPTTIASYFMPSLLLPAAAAATAHHVALLIAGGHGERRVGKVLPARLGDLGRSARRAVAEGHRAD